ncbi:hypothetical protein M3184_15280 [Metabacillus litoralis]|nr:hypothetical protein [Metabacillus litoralis]
MLLTFEKEDSTSFEYQHKFRLSYEDGNGETVPRGYKESEWKIMGFSLRDLEYIDV